MYIRTKPAIKSKSIQGGILALTPLAVFIGSALGLPIAQYIPDAVNLVITSVGGALAIWGRVKAETKIKGAL